MKQLMLALFLLLTACGAPAHDEMTITASMKQSMTWHADHIDALYPGVENVARACVDGPSEIYFNEVLNAYAVTCSLAASYGIVTLDTHEVVIDAFSVDDLSGFLADGWEK